MDTGIKYFRYTFFYRYFRKVFYKKVLLGSSKSYECSGLDLRNLRKLKNLDIQSFKGNCGVKRVNNTVIC